jgi:hypothetical protein
MSGIEKLVARFKTIPSDFTWHELVRLLKSFGYEEKIGYEEKKGAGSRRKFRGENLPAINLHEPHPGKIVKRYALRQVKAMLESEGLL